MNTFTLTPTIARQLDAIVHYLWQHEQASGQNHYYVDAALIASGYIETLRRLPASGLQQLMQSLDACATQRGLFIKKTVAPGEWVYLLNDRTRACWQQGGIEVWWQTTTATNASLRALTWGQVLSPAMAG